MASGNRLADLVAKEVERKEIKTIPLTSHHPGEEIPDWSLRNGWPPPELKLIRGYSIIWMNVDVGRHWRDKQSYRNIRSSTCLHKRTDIHTLVGEN